jgi:hypothetical protein
MFWSRPTQVELNVLDVEVPMSKNDTMVITEALAASTKAVGDCVCNPVMRGYSPIVEFLFVLEGSERVFIKTEVEARTDQRFYSSNRRRLW